ncbi:class I SAM-dependent methyltransferase [Streptomyces sp. NPDC005876]|uniref:class I SAM-dependent methyltransferase n=1 Tax=unclassified Streptomyces TaxID=2593676 RepID=UPI0033F9C04C
MAGQQYDGIIDAYLNASRFLGFYRDTVEFPSFLHALGDVRGKDVLVVGCGDGTYARLVKEHGAARVEGVDVSNAMISAARTAEARRPRGIAYHVHDAAHLPALGSFDLVLATHLLHYAPDHDSLAGMCRGLFSHCAPGGRMLAYVLNPDVGSAALESLGIAVERPGDPQEADAVVVRILTSPPTDLRVRHWPRSSLVRHLRRAGFHGVHWPPLHPAEPVGPEARERVRYCVEHPLDLLLGATAPPARNGG